MAQIQVWLIFFSKHTYQVIKGHTRSKIPKKGQILVFIEIRFSPMKKKTEKKIWIQNILWLKTRSKTIPKKFTVFFVVNHDHSRKLTTFLLDNIEIKRLIFLPINFSNLELFKFVEKVKKSTFRFESRHGAVDNGRRIMTPKIFKYLTKFGGDLKKSRDSKILFNQNLNKVES